MLKIKVDEFEVKELRKYLAKVRSAYLAYKIAEGSVLDCACTIREEAEGYLNDIKTVIRDIYDKNFFHYDIHHMRERGTADSTIELYEMIEEDIFESLCTIKGEIKYISIGKIEYDEDLSSDICSIPVAFIESLLDSMPELKERFCVDYIESPYVNRYYHHILRVIE